MQIPLNTDVFDVLAPPAIPSPFHNREDVDRRNTVITEGSRYTICPITKEKVEQKKKKGENKT